MLIDFGPFYTNTGSLLQLEYSKKSVNAGSTCIGFKYQDGIIFAVENPIESPLYKNSKRIKELSPNIFVAATGLMSDSLFITETIKENIHNESLKLDMTLISPTYKRMISELVSIFTRNYNLRPVGCSILSACYDGDFHLFTTDPTSLTEECIGAAIGKGTQRAKTEIEKLDVGNLDLKQAMEHCVRILYKSYDPLKDKDFVVEMCYMDSKSAGKMVRIDDNLVKDIVEMYKDLSVDE